MQALVKDILYSEYNGHFGESKRGTPETLYTCKEMAPNYEKAPKRLGPCPGTGNGHFVGLDRTVTLSGTGWSCPGSCPKGSIKSMVHT